MSPMCQVRAKVRTDVRGPQAPVEWVGSVVMRERILAVETEPRLGHLDGCVMLRLAERFGGLADAGHAAVGFVGVRWARCYRGRVHFGRQAAVLAILGHRSPCLLVLPDTSDLGCGTCGSRGPCRPVGPDGLDISRCGGTCHLLVVIGEAGIDQIPVVRCDESGSVIFGSGIVLRSRRRPRLIRRAASKGSSWRLCSLNPAKALERPAAATRETR